MQHRDDRLGDVASSSDVAPDSDATPGTGVDRLPVRRNLFHMMNAQLVTWAMAMVLAIVVPRFLGPDIVGQFRLATSLWLLGRILVAAGTTRFLQLEIARTGRPGLRFVGPVVLVRTAAFVVVAALLGVYAVASGRGHMFEVLMIIVAIDSLFWVWFEALSTAFVGLERMALPAFVNAVSRIAMTIVTLVAIVLNGDVYAIAAASGVGAALGLVILVRRLRPLTPILSRDDARHWHTVFSGSLPFMFSGAALVLYQQIDIIVISWTADDAAIGWYGTADSLFGSLLFPATVLTTTIFPTLGRLSEDPDELRRLVQRALTALVVLAVPIGLGAVLVGPSFATLLFGDAFAETGTVLAILGPVIILTFGTILFGTVAQATGRVRFWTSVLVGAALVTIPLDIVLVPWADERYSNGAIGGALAYVVTESVQFLIGLFVIVPFVLTRSLTWRIARTLAAGALMLAVGWTVRDAVVVLPMIVCAVVYVACLFAFRVVTDDERAMLRRISGKLGIGRRSRTSAP